jgi:hypothetical protein
MLGGVAGSLHRLQSLIQRSNRPGRRWCEAARSAGERCIACFGDALCHVSVLTSADLRYGLNM